MSRNNVNKKYDFPIGTRIELIAMDDPQAPLSGTRGTVDHIDDAGHIHMKWDNGSSLALVPDEDKFRTLTKEEIEKEKREMTMGNVHYTIYQLKDNEEQHMLRFTSLNMLKNGMEDIKASNYDKVYKGEIEPVNMYNSDKMLSICENLFRIFNTKEMPKDFTGHSLSVSDIIVLEYNGEEKAYYCDSFGFEKISSFVEQLNEVQINKEMENDEPEI